MKNRDFWQKVYKSKGKQFHNLKDYKKILKQRVRLARAIRLKLDKEIIDCHKELDKYK